MACGAPAHLAGARSGDRHQSVVRPQPGRYETVTSPLNLLIGTLHVFPAQNGSYLQDCDVFPPEKVRAWGRDEVEAERLWALSEEIVGQKFSS